MTSRVFVELDGNLRFRIEALIENLIDLCDQLDGDADLKEDADGEEEHLTLFDFAARAGPP
ncbi:MAG: hypothetical protein ACR652_05315 [Methylocystis sp.]|uniref:hypothetical protein n=1 Tax=Methylocystis sp. TaxID=1911079 RepID=UPI003DA5AAA9